MCHKLYDKWGDKMEKEMYVLGLVMTDGFKNKGQYCIELKKEDENVLLQISEDFATNLYRRTRDTNFAKDFSCTKLVIKDNLLTSLLDKFIPQEDKTNNAYVPNPFLFSPSLWRGILDGDGCYGYRKGTPYISFTTKSEKLKEAFCILVEQITGQKINATRNQRDNIYNLGVTSVNAKKLVKWLLSVDTFYIQRKKDIMESIVNWQPSGKQGESHRRWTIEEDNFVYSHTNQECVNKLNRSLGAIINRRTKLNRERREKNG